MSKRDVNGGIEEWPALNCQRQKTVAGSFKSAFPVDMVNPRIKPAGTGRTAEREAAKQAAAFELACQNGEVLNRAQEREKAAQEAAEAAKLKTVRQYADGVFMPTKEATFSEIAFLDDRIHLNPLRKVRRPAPRKDEQPKEEGDKALTVKELAHVLSCAAHEPLKWRAYISTLPLIPGGVEGSCAASGGQILTGAPER